MKTLKAEEVLAEQVPVERLEVSYIEDDAMTLRNRPLIEEFSANQAEKFVAALAGVEDPFQKPPTNRGDIFRGQHSVFLTRKAALPSTGRINDQTI
jgi:hypothetical protein